MGRSETGFPALSNRRRPGCAVWGGLRSPARREPILFQLTATGLFRQQADNVEDHERVDEKQDELDPRGVMPDFDDLERQVEGAAEGGQPFRPNPFLPQT